MSWLRALLHGLGIKEGLLYGDEGGEKQSNRKQIRAEPVESNAMAVTDRALGSFFTATSSLTFSSFPIPYSTCGEK